MRNYDPIFYKKAPEVVRITEDGKEKIFYKAGNSLYADEEIALNILRINNECLECGEFTGRGDRIVCLTCVEKMRIEKYNKLPLEEATEMLYSKKLYEYGDLDQMKELADEKGLSLQDLRIVNTEIEEPDLISRFEDCVSDYMQRFDDADDVDIPASLLAEIEKFCRTLPGLYNPVNIRPNIVAGDEED